MGKQPGRHPLQRGVNGRGQPPPPPPAGEVVLYLRTQEEPVRFARARYQLQFVGPAGIVTIVDGSRELYFHWDDVERVEIERSQIQEPVGIVPGG